MSTLWSTDTIQEVMPRAPDSFRRRTSRSDAYPNLRDLFLIYHRRTYLRDLCKAVTRLASQSEIDAAPPIQNTGCLTKSDFPNVPSPQMMNAGGWLFPPGAYGYNSGMMNAAYMYQFMSAPMSPTGMLRPPFMLPPGYFGNMQSPVAAGSPNFSGQSARGMGQQRRSMQRNHEISRPQTLTVPQIKNLSSSSLTRIIVDVLRESGPTGRERAWEFFER